MSKNDNPKHGLTPDEILQLLPPEGRKALMEMDPVIRKFILTASPTEAEFCESLGHEERWRFAQLPFELRSPYMRLTPSEKGLVAKLSDAEATRYLNMSPEERRAFADSSTVGKEQRKQAQNLAMLAASIAKAAIERLGDWAKGSPELATLANSLAHNHLHSGKPQATVQSEVLQALLNSPEILPRLTQELAGRIDPEIFRLRRYALPTVITEKVRGDMALPAIIEMLVQELDEGTPSNRPDSKENQPSEDELSDVRLKIRGRITS